MNNNKENFKSYQVVIFVASWSKAFNHCFHTSQHTWRGNPRWSLPEAFPIYAFFLHLSGDGNVFLPHKHLSVS